MDLAVKYLKKAAAKDNLTIRRADTSIPLRFISLSRASPYV